jgi:hypothetical protein
MLKISIHAKNMLFLRPIMLKIEALMSKNDTFMLTLGTFMLALESIIDPKTTIIWSNCGARHDLWA